MQKKLCALSLLLTASVSAADKVDLTLLKQYLGDSYQIVGSKPAIVKGLYEVQVNNQIIYLSADGEKVISGEIFDLKNNVRSTEVAKNQLRRDAINAIAEVDKIIYKAKDEKYKITIFTDITCGYCVKLHEKVPEYNRLGITVEYLAFPRAGVQSSAGKNMQRIWCAKNKTQALTAAKIKRVLPKNSCQGNQVAQQYALAEKLNVRGTPLIVLEDGTAYFKNREPEALLKFLQSRPAS